ncbi:unnamed protein product [Gongylonema pulchrum]|uniref:Uncharacterized protein n=1 Tax=Gongylonema pulchrum TaxID=637853 RepID=A0A183ETZ9_9BILA|nr:unnamed protein product [Gongylonema pulchrum]
MHTRFTLPQQFLSQMFFPNIPAMAGGSSADPSPSSSSTTISSPARLSFDTANTAHSSPSLTTVTAAVTATTAFLIEDEKSNC